MATLNPAVGVGAYTATLETLRNRVLVRCGMGAQIANPPPGVAALIDDFLISAQRQLQMRYPELVTERWFSFTMVAGTRFYLTTADDEGVTSPDFILNPRRIKAVFLEDLNGSFIPMIQGIDPQHYTMESQQGLPTHYEIRQAIEVMPSPDQAYILHIKADFTGLVFASDDDVCSIDDELLFLLSLAGAKSHFGHSDANSYYSQATSHLGQLTSGAHGTARYVPGTTPSAVPTKPVMV